MGKRLCNGGEGRGGVSETISIRMGEIGERKGWKNYKDREDRALIKGKQSIIIFADQSIKEKISLLCPWT